jgi:hypothetical protein
MGSLGRPIVSGRFYMRLKHLVISKDTSKLPDMIFQIIYVNIIIRDPN